MKALSDREDLGTHVRTRTPLGFRAQRQRDVTNVITTRDVINSNITNDDVIVPPFGMLMYFRNRSWKFAVDGPLRDSNNDPKFGVWRLGLSDARWMWAPIEAPPSGMVAKILVTLLFFFHQSAFQTHTDGSLTIVIDGHQRCLDFQAFTHEELQVVEFI